MTQPNNQEESSIQEESNNQEDFNNQKNIWSKPRQILLTSALAGLTLAVFGLIVIPKAANRQPANLNFPNSVEIPEWQFLKSAAIAPENPKLEEFFLDIYEYEYQTSTAVDNIATKINIKMYYTLGTRGESSEFLAKRFKIETATIPIVQKIQGNSETGFYSLFSYQDQSHLVSCINPRGVSTATSAQFLANRSRFDLQPERFWSWLGGQESLRDLRCLWVDIAVALPPETADPILEKVWGSWYFYWQNKFPQY